MAQNYTPIDDIITKPTPPPSFHPPESEPIIKKSEMAAQKAVEDKGLHEVVERDASPEVKKHVSVRKETISVDADLQRMGVRATQHRQHFPDYKRVILPIPDAAVLKGLHAPFTSSFRWLAELCILLLKKAHLHLRVVHGKVRRVLIRES